MNARPYVGRFAPSPTGPLHFGSLVAAVASFLDARHHNGRWLLRIEDVDPPREQTGAAEAIVATLRHYHLKWDGDILYQGSRLDAYRDHMQQLLEAGLAYRCRCSRSDLREQSVYPGTCSDATVSEDEPHSVRIRCAGYRDRFVDRLQGMQCHDLDSDFGDFVIWRRDDLPAYQLAVTLDDGLQGITDVVRGTDLLDSTPRQNLLRHLLKLPQPRFAHIPVAVNSEGAKLSKQTGAAAIDQQDSCSMLCRVLSFLRQELPPHGARKTPATIVAWAAKHWDINNLYGVMQQTGGAER